MSTMFAANNQHLEYLTEQQAVEVFRDLLWAEATASGIPKNLINVPSAITVPDGGIDAEVQGVEAPSVQGIIKPGLTRYQIKTGSFSLSGDADIRKILFRETLHELKPRIRTCLDKGGTLVVVLFGSDNPDAKDDQVKNRIVEQLCTIDETYADASVEIWRQNQILSFLTRFPSLSLRVANRDNGTFQSHRSWARQDDMQRDFKIGDSQHGVVEQIQATIRDASSAVHVRVWGEPGIGKTRLALEATRVPDLQPLVVYCEAASSFRESPLMMELLKDDNSFSVILVIDECDSDSRSYLWNKFKHLSKRIKLITLDSEYDETTGDIVYLRAPSLERDQVVRILQDYDVPEDQARRWAELCDGSPRVAHVIGSNLKSNPDDLLRPPDTVDVWRRYIEGNDSPNSVAVEQRTTLLRHIALFKRFGYGKPVVDEAKAIAALVQEVDPNITWGRFQEIVADLRKRRILQGETTLYITPKLLHIRLWTEWWDIYGALFEEVILGRSLPGQLVNWLMEMFQYAAESPVSAKVVSQLLGPSGPLEKENLIKSESGANFFRHLSEADPRSALNFLRRTVGTWNHEQLLDFSTGRRQVVWALKDIAVWESLFNEASLLLLKLAEAENEEWISNNASGEFISLFAIGPGTVASTEASGQQRLAILQEILQSSSSGVQRLAIDACNVALESRHWSRLVGPEHQGIRPTATLWAPATYGELWDCYRQTWRMLVDTLQEFDSPNRVLAVEHLLSHIRGLSVVENLADMLIQDVREMTSKGYIDKKQLLATVIAVVQYERENLPGPILAKWQELQDELAGHDFASLMNRYVGMDLLEDWYDDDGNRIDTIQLKLEELAQLAVDNADLLRPELGWLVTDKAENGFRFGYELRKLDTASALLPDLLTAQRKANGDGTLFFLGGYFRAYREVDERGWEAELNRLCDAIDTRRWLPELAVRSGRLTDAIGRRILNLLESDVISPSHLRMFVFGAVIRDLSRDCFASWIEHLLATQEYRDVVVALDLYAAYFRESAVTERLPKSLTLRLLTHDLLFQPGTIADSAGIAHDWATIGKWFLRDFAEDSVVLGQMMVEHFGEEGTIAGGFQSEAQTVLNEIAARYPRPVWDTVKGVLGPPIDARAFHVGRWLRGNDLFNTGGFSAIELFPRDAVWEWVCTDVERRAPYLATLVPPRLVEENRRVCWARELLVRFGDREDVRGSLQSNFSTEGSTGPYSAHLRSKRDALLEIARNESEPNVLLWLEEYTGNLEVQMEHALIEEERSSYFSSQE